MFSLVKVNFKKRYHQVQPLRKRLLGFLMGDGKLGDILWMNWFVTDEAILCDELLQERWGLTANISPCYSTVTLLARLRGLSTSQPRMTAM